MPKAVKPGAGGRSFGFAFGGLFAVIALWRAWRGRTDAATTFAVASAAMLLTAFAVPQVLDAPNRLWMRFARGLGWINSRILLSILFYVVITPYGALQRLIGRDKLGQKWRAEKPAWTDAPQHLRDPKHFEHLY
jgi:multisubunit Na+/H+ antiporter MnhG subunit